MHFPYFARRKGFPEQRMDDFLPVLGRWCRTTIGPTDRYGVYLFQENVVGIKGLPIRQSDPASVVATVTNSSSNNHSITLNIGCIDSFNIGGCATTAHASTMRVDVFEP
jgi:hypothetical protein